MFDVVTTRYDFYRASDAFRSFDKLVRQHLTARTNSIQRLFRLDRVFGESVYFYAIQEFENQLALLGFEETLSPETSGNPRDEYGPSQLRRCRRVVPRFFSNHTNLLGICRNLIEKLFGSVMQKSGKHWWCEKTPFNLLPMDFLWDLFPNTYVLHIKRDPRGVV